MLNPTIKIDYTSHANPRRGYHDLSAVVTFAPDEGTEEERKAFLEAFRADRAKSSMWCGVFVWTAPDTYSLNYGYDSGD